MQRTGMSVTKLPKIATYKNMDHYQVRKVMRGDPVGGSLTRMEELEIPFVLTTGKTGRAQGAHKEA